MTRYLASSFGGCCYGVIDCYISMSALSSVSGASFGVGCFLESFGLSWFRRHSWFQVRRRRVIFLR